MGIDRKTQLPLLPAFFFLSFVALEGGLESEDYITLPLSLSPVATARKHTKRYTQAVLKPKERKMCHTQLITFSHCSHTHETAETPCHLVLDQLSRINSPLYHFRSSPPPSPFSWSSQHAGRPPGSGGGGGRGDMMPNIPCFQTPVPFSLPGSCHNPRKQVLRIPGVCRNCRVWAEKGGRLGSRMGWTFHGFL